MKEELIKKIEEVVKGEKLAMDSYFFCGSGSDLPDAELISAGEAYLAAVKAGGSDEAAKEKLFECLAAAAAKKPAVLKSRAVAIEAVEDPKAAVIKEVLEHKDIL